MEQKARKKLSKKAIIVIIVGVVLIAIATLSAVIGGHAVYERNCEAVILNQNSVFRVDRPQFLTYIYEDEKTEIDFSQVIEVSKGASFYIDKIQDEDNTVTKGEGTVLDVSKHSQRLAVVRVVSKNGVGKTDYRITVVPKSAENNVIDFNVSDAEIDLDNITLNYSGNVTIDLPEPKKEYIDHNLGITFNYDFLGWYTTPDFVEGTEIDKIEKGSEGSVSVYARFAENSAPVYEDGFIYVTYGNYPQEQVTDFNVYLKIKNSATFKNASSGTTFSFNAGDGTKTYYKFTPASVPNLGGNGYSANSSYVFKVQPIVWRILAPKDRVPSDNDTVTVLSQYVLNCSSYSTNDETLFKSIYDSLGKLGIELEHFMRYFFDGDTMYGMTSSSGGWGTILKLIKVQVRSNDLRNTLEGDDPYNSIGGMVAQMFSASERNNIIAKQFNSYKLIGSGTDSYYARIWPLNYSDTLNANYGFSTDYKFNDPLRKAYATDFAKANGVYVSDSKAHLGQASWWLRGAGGAQGVKNGNATSGYGYNDKRVAYVKYTGYVHAYGSLNNTIRSGVRPAMQIKYSSIKGSKVN